MGVIHLKDHRRAQAGNARRRAEDWLEYAPASGAELPYYTHRVQAGSPFVADDSCERRLSADDLVLNKEATFWFRAAGKSMEPYIMDGDILMCDRSITPINGDVVLALVHGELTIKSYRRLGSTVRLIPSNPAFSIIDVTEDMQLAIQGVIINIVRPTHQRFRVDN